MKTWKRALALVLALVMALSLVALPSFAEGEEKDTYSVVIKYVFADGSQAAPSWTATLARGSAYHNTVTSPTVVGYTPDRATVELDYTAINEDVTETVIYKPAEVSFTVKHYQQNTDNDNYTLADTETRTGYTESVVGAAWPRPTRASPPCCTTPPLRLPPTAAPRWRFTTTATTIC